VRAHKLTAECISRDALRIPLSVFREERIADRETQSASLLKSVQHLPGAGDEQDALIFAPGPFLGMEGEPVNSSQLISRIPKELWVCDIKTFVYIVRVFISFIERRNIQIA